MNAQQKIKKVLFCPLASHDNPSAARVAAEFANRNDAALTVLGVVAERSRLSELIHGHSYEQRLLDEERRILERKLKRCAPDCSDRKLVVGSPALAIIQEVMSAGHDLVVVSHNDGENHATIKRLLRKCPCPVWVVRPTRAKTHRILAAINPNPDETELNRRILDFATGTAEAYGGELHVVHSWELAGETTMRNSAFIHPSNDELAAMLDREERGHRAALDELLIDLDPKNAELTVHLLKGPPASVVPELVRHRRINLLVIGTVARTGIPGLVMGNTAERILDDVRCSVIAVKPPGFVSPIPSETLTGLTG